MLDALFFYYDYVPGFVKAMGEGYPFDFACMCSLPNTFNVFIHIIILGAIILAVRKRPEVMKDRFFIFLFVGILFSMISKILDWYMNFRTATGHDGMMYFEPNIDVFVALFQFIGISIILYAIITKLFQVHHERVNLD